MQDFDKEMHGNHDNNDKKDSNEPKTYYYTVTNEPERKKKNPSGKKTVALALLIVVCVLMSSVGTSLAMTYVYQNLLNDAGNEHTNGPSNTGTSAGNGSGNLQGNGVNDTIIINKNETNEDVEIGGAIGEENMSVAQVTHLVADSVVEITTSSVKYNVYYGQYVESGAGSGVIIGRSNVDPALYYVVTNHHVIDDAENIYVSLRNGSEFEAIFVGSDIISDIAVVQIRSDAELNVATLGNGKNVLVGEDVVVIGNPLGQLGGTVTDGIISALERELIVDGLKMNLMQTNAAISPGNSGGGMFNMKGELIGIINAKSTEESAEGLGFAIPIDYAYDVVIDLLKQGYVSGRAALPFAFQEYTYSTSIMGGTSTYLVITERADAYSIKPNDIIYTIDGIQITTKNSLLALLLDYEVGDSVELVVARTEGRASKLYTYTVTLTESVPNTAS